MTDYTVSVKSSEHRVRITHVSRTIGIYHGGRRGLKGDKGDKGDTPLAIQPEPPTDEDFLWVDTDDNPPTSSDFYVQLAANPDSLIFGNITRDVNGAVTTASVIWPDMTTGTYTATQLSTSFLGAVDAYTITYNGTPTRTYTQPAVTRDADGAIIIRPVIGVS